MLDRKSKLKEHIIIGTPGKVLDWSSLKFNFFDVKKIRVFVLDEADVMIAIQANLICHKIVFYMERHNKYLVNICD